VTVCVCRDEKWTDRKRKNVRKIDPECEGTERRGVVLVLRRLSVS